MSAGHNDEFRRDAARIALASGLTRRQVASDSGTGHSPSASGSGCFPMRPRPPHRAPSYFARTNGCARRTVYSGRRGRRQKRRLSLSRLKSHVVSIHCRLSRQPDTRPPVPFDGRGGSRAWKHRPLSHRQRRGMVLLAHVRDQRRQGPGSHGRPRMTAELIEPGLRVGLMRQNGIQVIRSRKFKRIADSGRSFNIAPNLCSRTSQRAGRARSGLAA